MQQFEMKNTALTTKVLIHPIFFQIVKIHMSLFYIFYPWFFKKVTKVNAEEPISESKKLFFLTRQRMNYPLMPGAHQLEVVGSPCF